VDERGIAVELTEAVAVCWMSKDLEPRFMRRWSNFHNSWVIGGVKQRRIVFFNLIGASMAQQGQSQNEPNGCSRAAYAVHCCTTS